MISVAKTLFHVVSIAVFVEVLFQKKGKGQEHIAGDLTRPGQRPGEFLVIYSRFYIPGSYSRFKFQVS